MQRFVYIFLLLMMLSSCSFNDFDDASDPQIPTPMPNMSIATLRGLYRGESTFIESGRPIVISGVVTTSDKANNFFRTFIIEDYSGSVEVKAGLYDLHTVYRIGQQITIIANGLTMGMESGVLQLGLSGGSTGYETDYLAHRYIIDCYVIRGVMNRPLTGRRMLISEIKDEFMGGLFTIDNLKLDLLSSQSRDTTWAISERLSSTGIPKSVSLKFRSTPTDSIYVTTSGYASFAADNVPLNNISLTGIISKGKLGSRTIYQLKIRDLDDVKEY